MKFKVWKNDIDTGPYDPVIFDAFDYEHAATEWANFEDDYTADYYIAGGQDVVVCVQALGSEEVHEYLVQGRIERAYSAHPVKGQK